MRKTALASSSSGQPSQPKKPCLAPSNQVCLRCERNLVLRSFLTEEDVRRVVREELERAKSHPAEYCQSCTGNALEDVVHSLENAVQKLIPKTAGLSGHEVNEGLNFVATRQAQLAYWTFCVY